MNTVLTIATPEGSIAQRLAALEHANHIRSWRAQLKRDLKADRIDLVDLLVAPPELLQTAKVFDFLLAVPKIGRVKANTILRQHDVSPSKTIGGLTNRQRDALIGALRGRGDRRR